MRFFDLLPRDEYLEALEAGYIRVQENPDCTRMIANYTEKAAYENVWNVVTRTCRGLIWEPDTGIILARPFPKFFNYGQAEAPQLRLSEPCRSFDKLDGSLGILYKSRHYPVDEWSIATRGSFTSEQAVHATEKLQEYIGGEGWTPSEDCTYLFEIVYPENRIVVDYGDVDDLFLLEVLNTETGEPAVDYAWTYPGPWVNEFDFETLEQALLAPPRLNAEGLVLFFPEQNERIKIKQEDYVRLHRIVTGLNARSVWGWLREGKRVEDMITDVPDEFHEWITKTAFELSLQYERNLLEYTEMYYSVIENLNDVHGESSWDRKDFALLVQSLDEKWALFALLDGKDITDQIWKKLKPVADWNPLGRAITEDVA